jgi:hypothetical protein
MRILFPGLLFFISFFTFSSCSKSTVTNTVVKNDTVIVNDTIIAAPSKPQILSQQGPWEIGEAFYNVSGIPQEYLRGSINNIGIDYDPIQFVFNSNQTGTYTDSSGVYEMTWQFTTSDLENMQMVITQIPNDTLNWSLVSIADSAIFLTNTTPGAYIQNAKLIPVN